MSIAFGLTTKTTPEKIEEELKDIIPRDEWFHFTNRMIDYGRTHFPARRRDYADPISQKLAKLSSDD